MTTSRMNGEDQPPTDEIRMLILVEKGQENLQHWLFWYLTLMTVPQRVFPAGDNICIAEQTKMNDCYYEKKDWRLCKQEVIYSGRNQDCTCLVDVKVVSKYSEYCSRR